MSRRGRMVSIVLAALGLLVTGSPLAAQTTGRIQGQIVDAQNAVVPGATVTITSPALQGALTEVTDADGRFRFPSVPPGRYTVKAELANFKTFEQPNIEVGLDRTVTVPVTMQLASVRESVTVTAASPVAPGPRPETGATRSAWRRNPVRP